MEPTQKQYVPSQPAPTPAPIQSSTPVQSPAPANNIVPPNFTVGNMPKSGNSKKVGPIVAGLVVIIILIVVALYVLASRVNQQATPIDNTTATNNSIPTDTTPLVPATEVEVKAVTGTADDLQSLQADLNASTNGVDAQSI